MESSDPAGIVAALHVKTRPPEFVSFHADRPAGASEPHPNANLGASSYMRMLDLLYRSARLTNPGAACTLLTDAATRVTGVRGPVRRFDQPIDHTALMLSRSRAQLAYVEASSFERPLVLLDSDILLNGSLQPVLDEDFDIGLTWRQSKTMPINGGLLVLNNRRPTAARDFLRRFLQIYVERYAADSNASWFGDQLALRDAIGLRYSEMEKQNLVVKDGCRIRLLPCEVWNFSPDNRLSAIQNGLPDKVVLHFKGPRKRLMEPYWTAFLQWRESFWPWASRRGKRAQLELGHLAAAESRAMEAEAAAKANP